MMEVIKGYYTCPMCGKKSLYVGVHDNQRYYRGDLGCEYEKNPWGGLFYALHHAWYGDCILCTRGNLEPMGGKLFKTAQDAANAIPETRVVRCGECKYRDRATVNKKGYLICPASQMEITEEDFCSYGERKAGEGEGAFSRGVNTGLDIARSAMRNPDAIPTLPHPSGWVSVNERLPSEEIDVLLLVRETEYYGKHGEKRHVYRWVFSGWNIDGEWATTYCHGHKMLSNQAEEDPKIEYKVTHWMPLPDPPEEVTNNAV